MAAKATPKKQQRLGRPVGGGNEPEAARELLLDAAERCLIKSGYRASTMEVIAREAGYTRTIAYRHFNNRAELDLALLQRGTLRQIGNLLERIGTGADLATLVTESAVLIATDLVEDPLFKVFAEQTDGGNIANMLTGAPQYIGYVESLLDGLVGGKGILRESLRHRDVAQYLLGFAMNLLVSVTPSWDDPDELRRYVRTFVLPAILAEPPEPESVFDPI